MNNKILIGLTGSFGSGCSELRKVLEAEFGFGSVKLSDIVKEAARARGLNEKDRNTLQDVGNDLRKSEGRNYLAKEALKRAEQFGKELVVFDGIRNTGEISEFRNYSNFYLVVVDCSEESRWERLKDRYDDDRKQFTRDDSRDKNEGIPHGQQVLRCVEEADILFINEENYKTSERIKAELKSRFRPYIDLITREKPRNPSLEETMMTVASTLALQSHCLKRRVGAVLCDPHGYIVSAAYNEVPEGERECEKEYGICYRDQLKKEFTEELLSKFDHCPKCTSAFKINRKDVDYNCPNCGNDLSNLIPPYKALDKCRSLHAEETTILKAAQYQINGSILYTTTFPCMQCAKRILQTGIKNIVYIDPYPEIESIFMLEKKEVKTKKFEGVRAQAYYKLFNHYR